MANIKVDPDVLRQKAKDIRTYKQQHDDAITKLNTLVSGLDAEWVGTAKTNYVTSYNEFKSTFDRFSAQMEEMAKKLEVKAGDFEVADK